MPRPTSRRSSLVRLLDEHQQPVYLLDAERRIAYCNRALADLFELSPDELIGLRCDYHTEAIKDAPSISGLCPAPDQGDVACARGVVFLPHRQSCPAQFWALRDAREQAVGLLVGVLSEEPSSTTPAPTFETSGSRLHQLIWEFRQGLATEFQIDQLVGKSPAMQRVREQLTMALGGKMSVLVIGPEGTGREHVARTIHYAGGADQAGPLVPLSCELLDAELLHTTMTAFIQQCAELETEQPPALLLLDVDQLPADAQAELLGFLAIREFELRALSTSRQPLEELAMTGDYHRELAYALSTLTVELPPLDSRPEDLPLLAQFLIEQHNAKQADQLAGFTSDAMEQIVAAKHWPGNHDEFREFVRQCIKAASGTTIESSDLPRSIRLGMDAALHPIEAATTIDLDDWLAEVEKSLIEQALSRSSGNRTQAAKSLGISRARLIRRIEHFALGSPPGT